MKKSTINLIDRFKRSLDKISVDVRSRVNKPGGLNEETLLELILNPQDHGIYDPEQPDDDIVKISYDHEHCFDIGKKAINCGNVAYCIMAGGNTQLGMPKALLRVPRFNISLLALKLFQATGTGPIWVFVDPKSRDNIVDHVRSQVGLNQSRIHFIDQHESYFLTPDNQISFIDYNKPNLYICGDGDLFSALSSSRFLNQFIETSGKYISIVSINNVANDLDPVNVGRHILSNSKVSCKVVKRLSKDYYGVLCNVNGSNQIVEPFMFYNEGIENFKWLNTNSFIINANINFKPLGHTWNRIKKNINGKLLIQYKRLLQELTCAYDTSYFEVKRDCCFALIDNFNDLV